MKTKREILILSGETFKQSLISDLISLAVFLIAIWFSRGDLFWSWFFGIGIVVFMLTTGSATKGKNIATTPEEAHARVNAFFLNTKQKT